MDKEEQIYQARARLNPRTLISTSKISAEQEFEQLLQLQRSILESVAFGADFQKVIHELCVSVEEILPRSMALLMLMDPDDGLLYLAAGPSLPPNAAVQLNPMTPGIGYGSCGSAAYCGAPVYVSDAYSDPRWQHIRGIAQEFGLRTCWSVPVNSQSGEILGTFGTCFTTRRSPTPFQSKLLETSAYLAGIAVERHSREKARQSTEQRLLQWATAFENTFEGVIITDARGKILDVNRAFSRITGFTREEAQGQTPRLLRSGRHNSDFYRSLWDTLLISGRWQGEIWNRRKNGDVYPEWLSITKIPAPDGKPSHYVAVFADISPLKESEQQLFHLAHHDPLTGLPNRLLFGDRLEHALAIAKRESAQVAVLFLDLDRFKNINDSLGHAFGDLLLKEVAARLRGCIRAEDTVARLAGDEFTLILEHLDETSDAGIVAEKLLNTLEQPFSVNERDIFVSASIGVSLFPRDGLDAESLLKKADAAMYRAKNAGRNNYAYYVRS